MKKYVQRIRFFWICIFFATGALVMPMTPVQAEVGQILATLAENSSKEETTTSSSVMQEKENTPASAEDTAEKNLDALGEGALVQAQPMPDEVATTDVKTDDAPLLSPESVELQPVESDTLGASSIQETKSNTSATPPEQAQPLEVPAASATNYSVAVQATVTTKEQPAIVFNAPLLKPGQELVKIVYVSRLADIQKRSTQGALSSLARVLEQIRNDFPNTIFIHGGSVLGPSAFSYFDKGAHMVGLLNFLEPTVLSLGRRDFVHKEDEVTLRAKEAGFPFLCANLQDPLTVSKALEGLNKTVVTEVGAYKIGITGLVSPELGTTFIPDRVELTGGYELLPELVQSMHKEGAGFIITLADFVPQNPQQILSEFGVDMLLVSDIKDNLFQFFNQKPYGVFKQETEVAIFDVVFTPQNGNKPLAQVLGAPQLIDLETIHPHPTMEAEIKEFSASLEKLLNFPIGTTPTALDTSTELIRTKENAFANIVTDAVREYYRADIALVNAGAIRGNQKYMAGSVLTRRDIYTELPFHDTATFIELDGATLLGVLEHAVSQVEHKRGQFLHVSGMQFLYNPKATIGARVQKVTIGTENLQPKKLYSVGIASYLANGGDGFTMLAKQKRLATVHPTQGIAEIVRNFLAERHTIAASVEGRIVTFEEK